VRQAAGDPGRRECDEPQSLRVSQRFSTAGAMGIHSWIGSPRALNLGLDTRAALTATPLATLTTERSVPPCGEVTHTGEATPVSQDAASPIDGGNPQAPRQATVKGKSDQCSVVVLSSEEGTKEPFTTSEGG
jgi:hypothetical protein